MKIKQIIGGWQSEVTIWDSRNGEPLHIWQASNTFIRELSLSPDGTHLATGGQSEGVAFVLDITTGKEVAVLWHDENMVYGITYSPSARFIVTSCLDKKVYLWEAPALENPQHKVSFSFSMRIPSVVPSASSQSASSESVSPRVPLQVFEVRGDLVTCTCFYADENRLVTGLSRGSLHMWDLKTGLVEWLNLSGCGGVDVSQNGKMVVSGSQDKTVRFRHGESGEVIHVFEGHDSLVVLVGFSPDSRRVAFLRPHGVITIWNSRNGEQLRTWKAYNNWIRQPFLSPNGTHLTTCNWLDKTAFVFDISTGERVAALKHADNLNDFGIAYSPSGQFIATECDDKKIYLWAAPYSKIRVLKTRSVSSSSSSLSRIINYT
ncbi:WD40 repeat-like protein [Paxillus ammoniavirescens]|nr:WD40 repeat-like protein [Paxillus ammoniavirescens]